MAWACPYEHSATASVALQKQQGSLSEEEKKIITFLRTFSKPCAKDLEIGIVIGVLRTQGQGDDGDFGEGSLFPTVHMQLASSYTM